MPTEICLRTRSWTLHVTRRRGCRERGACECSYSLARPPHGLHMVNNARAIKVTRCNARCLQLLHHEHHTQPHSKHPHTNTHTHTSLTLITVRSCSLRSFCLALPQLVREQFGLLRLFLQKHHLLLELLHVLLRTTLSLARTVGGGTHESSNSTYISPKKRRTRRIGEVEMM